MEKADKITNYSYPVHRSIMKRQLIMGIPLIPLVITVLLTIIIVLDFKLWIILPFSGLLLYIMKEITKKDEYLLEIFLNSLLEPDHLE
jgi:type IV secretory pathway TrbD component